MSRMSNFILAHNSPFTKLPEMAPVLTHIGGRFLWTFNNACGAAVIDFKTMEEII